MLVAGVGIGLPKMIGLNTRDVFAAESGRTKMRLIMRADNLGYSQVTNIGAFRAIEEGVITSAEVMFDTPGTQDTLERLRKYPWLSIGWHNDCLGKPVLGQDRVPLLVDKDGHFKSSMRNGASLVADSSQKPGDITKSEGKVNYDELVAEFRAQMLLSIKILGRAPDTLDGSNANSLVTKAENQVAREFGLKSDQHDGTSKYLFDQTGKFHVEKYDPMVSLRINADWIMHQETVQLAFHPASPTTILLPTVAASST